MVFTLNEEHKPVLAQQVAALWQAYFNPRQDEKPLQTNRYRNNGRLAAVQLWGETRPLLYVDATLGEAGHARLLLEQQPQAYLLGIDADPSMLARARYFLQQTLGTDASNHRCQFQQQCFSDYFSTLASGYLQADLILFDLGISLFHYNSARGFSFRPQDPDEVLDMRLNPQQGGASAAQLLQKMSQSELANIFYRYGELHNGQQLARAIVEQRHARQLYKARALADFIWQLSPANTKYSSSNNRNQEPKSQGRKHKIHPATKVFQALRIAVNNELEKLERSLPSAFEQLKPYGLLAVITFHSLEDRLVKQQFRLWQEQGQGQWVYKKAVQAPYNTQLASERSAKLRVIRKMASLNYSDFG